MRDWVIKLMIKKLCSTRHTQSVCPEVADEIIQEILKTVPTVEEIAEVIISDMSCHPLRNWVEEGNWDKKIMAKKRDENLSHLRGIATSIHSLILKRLEESK